MSFSTEVNEQHEGKRKNEALWPVFQITWQRSRYVYDMHYVYKAISKDVLDYCIRSVSEAKSAKTSSTLTAVVVRLDAFRVTTESQRTNILENSDQWAESGGY